MVVTQLGYGGAERQSYELLRSLRGTSWEPVVIICMSRQIEPYGPMIEALGYPLEILPRFSSFDVGRIGMLSGRLRRHRIELVHAVHILASAYCWAAGRLGGRFRWLPSVRGTVIRPGAVKRLLFRRMFGESTRILVNSHSGAQFLIQAFGAPEERIAVIPNGIDFEALRRQADPALLPRLLGLPPGARVIGYVGKNNPVKNVPLLFEVAARVMAREPAAHLVLIGDGLAAALRDVGGGLPPGRVHPLGPRQDVPALLSGMDVLLMTSRSEGCPNTILEALGIGTPVVSTDVGDIGRMLAPGVNGWLAADGDADALTAGVLGAFERGQAGREQVRSTWPALESQFALGSMVSRTVELWETVRGAADPDGLSRGDMA